MQDFGDGPGGAVYQQRLNVILRYFRKIYPDDFYNQFTAFGHDISDILQQIESESTPMATVVVGSEEQDQDEPDTSAVADEESEENPAANKDQQEITASDKVQEEVRNNPTAVRKFFKGLWKSKNHEMDLQEVGIHHAEGGSSSMRQIKSGLLRLFRR